MKIKYNIQQWNDEHEEEGNMMGKPRKFKNCLRCGLTITNRRKNATHHKECIRIQTEENSLGHNQLYRLRNKDTKKINKK